jgi:formylmethanofuran dehydrogenase subunit D
MIMPEPEKGVPLVIITYQDIYQWITMQRDGWGDSYQVQSAMVRLSPVDLKNLGLNDGDLVELGSEAGTVVVKAKSDPACEEGTALMLASLYSNRLASYDPSRSRLPNLKRIDVIAKPTKNGVTPLSDLLMRKMVA